MTKHPVHIVDDDGQLSPTALIPFCEFDGDLSAMGVKIEQFGVPVCKSFRPKIFQDQLCYTVDPNTFKNNHKSKELSLTLFINLNEERQMLTTASVDQEDKNIIIETTGKDSLKLII